jgi:nucleoside-diphosphate-sugar epimerase
MKALVTGATGFLGQKLAYRLSSMGWEVTAVGRNKSIGQQLKNDGINFLQADLSDSEKMTNACSEQDYVFHSGALSSPWGKYQDFYQSNVIGTKNIIDGCLKYNVKRLIHVSTPSLYFHYEDKLNISENDKLPEKFVNFYAETKFLAEQEVDKAFMNGVPVISIRPRALFGPGDNAILPRLIRANEKGAVPVIGDNKVLVDITYVENVVDALLLCMNSPSNTLGKKYNITNGEPIILTEVLQDVFQKLGQDFKPKHLSFSTAYNVAGAMEFISKYLLFGKEPILTRYTVGVLSKSQTLDITKARDELGYTPKVSIQEGIELFLKWWRETENER